jgi:hypothetical protein
VRQTPGQRNYEVAILWNNVNVTRCEQFQVVNKLEKIDNYVRHKQNCTKNEFSFAVTVVQLIIM